MYLSCGKSYTNQTLSYLGLVAGVAVSRQSQEYPIAVYCRLNNFSYHCIYICNRVSPLARNICEQALFLALSHRITYSLTTRQSSRVLFGILTGCYFLNKFNRW
ncbi:unnamed protein product [Allacma fusca]|uniref:Uncharacterized protein n=1 Tax=Allacma fusca TaxID=39272 RepID=A0A8J2NLE6_9HEXA|nr:unnamed protein product [Allacma fusca]